jgi:hypothetical protein
MLYIVWRFHAKPDQLGEFLQHYGPAGTWTELFRRSADYRGTLILRDVTDPLDFLIVDRWHSQQMLTKFRQDYFSEYEALDQSCERFTQEEHLVGTYEDEQS